MREKVNKETEIIGKNKIFFEEIDSTQMKAKELAEEKSVKNGTIIITDNQIKGIGTHDRKWYTYKAKNLTFTIIIYPKCTIQKLNTLTIDIAKVLTNSINTLYNYKLGIKKPNDIIYNGRKMGGILTQITSKGDKIKYLLIGIGFNVNQTEFNEEVKNIATSMKTEFEKEFNREEILNEFLYEFEKYLLEKGII